MNPGKKRILIRWLLPALCALSTLVIWTIARLPGPPANPIYRGTPLSQHLYNIYAPYPSRLRPPGPYTPQEIAKLQAEFSVLEKKRTDSANALGRTAAWSSPNRAEIIVGPEALPLLTNWMATAPPTGWKPALGRRLSRFVDLPSLTRDHRMLAWSFLSEFPMLINDPDLAIFFPGLTNPEPRIRDVAALALGRQIRAGMKVDKDKIIRHLFPVSAYHHMASDQSMEYKRSFSYSGPVPSEQQIRSIIDALDPRRDLIPLYTLEMGHIHARVGAAMELTDKPRYPARTIPLLISNLSSTNRSVQERCAQALAAYGAEARSALSSLTNLLQHPRERVRLAASNAIVSINTHSDSLTSIQSP